MYKKQLVLTKFAEQLTLTTRGIGYLLMVEDSETKTLPEMGQ